MKSIKTTMNVNVMPMRVGGSQKMEVDVLAALHRTEDTASKFIVVDFGVGGLAGARFRLLTKVGEKLYSECNDFIGLEEEAGVPSEKLIKLEEAGPMKQFKFEYSKGTKTKSVSIETESLRTWPYLLENDIRAVVFEDVRH